MRTRTNNGSNSAVTEADADVELNQPSGVESIEMHVPLTSKYYGSRVLLATYKLTAILLVVSLLDKEMRS